MAASNLIERLAAGGIVSPRAAIAEARRANLPLELACALLEKESAGGQNVYGHDPSIFRGAGKVTRSNYAEYKRRRRASGNKAMQGVGPCQLTWWEFQDQADAQGGCWRPRINMRVGFRHLAGLIARYGESDGARRYNGSGAAAEAYSRDLLAKARRWASIIDGAEVPAASAAGPRLLRRGDSGKGVERLTRRLASVRSPVTREPYLDAPRPRLTAKVEGAVKAFQREHGLQADGVVGPLTMGKLRSTAKAEKARRQPAAAADGDRQERRTAAPARITAMAHEVQRLEDETARAWRTLVAYGHRRRRRLLDERKVAEAEEGDLSPDELAQLLAALARIEGKLGTLVEISMHEPEAPGAGATPAPEPAAAAAAAGASVAKAPPVTEGPAAVATAVEAPPARPLEKYSVPELVREIDALEKRTRALRGELIGRYERVDDQLVRLVGHDGRDGHVRDRPPRRRPSERRRDGGDRPSREERDPLGGRVVNTTLGDRGRFVRRSKIALSRYLAKQGSSEHAGLRRTLRREAATPRTGGIASPAWGKAVRAAQHLAGRPVTGELDGELTKLLLPYWPRDQVVKRIVRSTPAWRAIPGQLTPNFNAKELACKDAARTPYVTGLMRDQGLTRKEAKARAKALAERLERVRRLGGNRPLIVTSAFRTRAYNASLSGSATNSAHTRGYAVDLPPPKGVSLDQHKQHVLKAFECGVGYYPMGRGYFVHGDFDKTLGGRRIW